MNILENFKMGTSCKPMYIQIADCFIDNISRGKLKKDERIPSINEFSKAFHISRDTVEKGYNILKEKRVVKTIKGKGTYVDSAKLVDEISVLFLINKLSTYKLEMYNSFRDSIGFDYHTDFEIYNCDESVFLSLMEKHLDYYDYFIIMPHFKNAIQGQNNFSNESLEIIKSISREKLIIMDNNELKIDGDIIEIYQDFENDICNALNEGWEKIKKYNRINLVVAEENSYSYLNKIKKGFVNFCIEQSMDYKIINKIKEDVFVDDGDLFVVIEDDDLVKLIDLAKAKDFSLGKDIGIISCDETPLKRLLGIAVVSTDFNKMGATAAEMIVANKKGKIKNPFQFIDRDSI
ncbi:MAG: GntR family transcriptional regulator [Flavobacterium sp.]|nr:GntR family transcriptional regulator [Flavobacterium sp.]